jgi:hypothetical protein
MRFAVGLVSGVVFAGGQPQDDLRELAVRLERSWEVNGSMPRLEQRWPRLPGGC